MDNMPRTTQEEINALTALLDSPGWKLISQQMNDWARSEYASMIASTEPHMMARHMGSFRALKDMLEYPAIRLEANRAQLNRGEYPDVGPY